MVTASEAHPRHSFGSFRLPRPWGGGPGAGRAIDPGGLDQLEDCRGFRGPGRHGPASGAGGVEALKMRVAPGPVPVKSQAALRVVTPCWKRPWPTAPTGRSPGCALRSKRARACASAVRSSPRRYEKNVRWRPPRHMLKGRQIADPVERYCAALRRRERGVSPSLSCPRLGEVGSGQARKVAILGSLDHRTRRLIVVERPSESVCGARCWGIWPCVGDLYHRRFDQSPFGGLRAQPCAAHEVQRPSRPRRRREEPSVAGPRRR
jgi:hypothetical protein